MKLTKIQSISLNDNRTPKNDLKVLLTEEFGLQVTESFEISSEDCGFDCTTFLSRSDVLSLPKRGKDYWSMDTRKHLNLLFTGQNKVEKEDYKRGQIDTETFLFWIEM